MASATTAGGVSILHIGKTGGTSLKDLLATAGITSTGDGRPVAVQLHGTKLVGVLAAHPENLAAFFLRDPVTRFVSGFNSRLRQGAPIAHIPWRPAEKELFERFPTPNELAEALSSDDAMRQDHAIIGMDATIHLRQHYTYWLRSTDYLDSRIDRLVFVGLQESYDEDVERLLAVLGVPADRAPSHLHRAPSDSSTELSDQAVANLRAWYARDFELYDWAVRHRDLWTAQRREGLLASTT